MASCRPLVRCEQLFYAGWPDDAKADPLADFPDGRGKIIGLALLAIQRVHKHNILGQLNKEETVMRLRPAFSDCTSWMLPRCAMLMCSASVLLCL